MTPTKETLETASDGPSQDDLVDMLAEEKIEQTKIELREKAEKWAEEKANEKAIAIANKEKILSLELKSFEDLKTQIKYYSDGWALPKGLSEAQAMMTVQMGKQMWMSMFEALQWIWYVNGKMIIYWEVMISQLTKAGYKIEFIKTDANICEVKISWANWEITETFKIEQAKNAWWVKSFWPWKDQPHLMLRYKAIRQWMKFLCPEVMSWLTTYEEAVTETQPSIEAPNEVEIQNTITDKFEKNEG